LRIGTQSMLVHEHVATAIGLIFIVDPLVPPAGNSFILRVLEQVERVVRQWRRAGVSNLPARDRRVPIAIVATKADALHPGHALLSDAIELEHLVGAEQAERVSELAFWPYCGSVTAWGEGPGSRFAGTRYQPAGVLKPLQDIFKRLPKLLGRAAYPARGTR
jgi:hypothetical protein